MARSGRINSRTPILPETASKPHLGKKAEVGLAYIPQKQTPLEWKAELEARLAIDLGSRPETDTGRQAWVNLKASRRLQSLGAPSELDRRRRSIVIKQKERKAGRKLIRRKGTRKRPPGLYTQDDRLVQVFGSQDSEQQRKYSLLGWYPDESPRSKAVYLDEVYMDIYILMQSGVSKNELSRRYGFTRAHISNICRMVHAKIHLMVFYLDHGLLAPEEVAYWTVIKRELIPFLIDPKLQPSVKDRQALLHAAIQNTHHGLSLKDATKRAGQQFHRDMCSWNPRLLSKEIFLNIQTSIVVQFQRLDMLNQGVVLPSSIPPLRGRRWGNLPPHFICNKYFRKKQEPVLVKTEKDQDTQLEESKARTESVEYEEPFDARNPTHVRS